MAQNGLLSLENVSSSLIEKMEKTIRDTSIQLGNHLRKLGYPHPTEEPNTPIHVSPSTAPEEAHLLRHKLNQDTLTLSRLASGLTEYIAHISLHVRFGYADDTAFLAISPSLATNCQALSDSLQEALDWDAAEGITFAPDKYELLRFSRHRTDQDPNSTPSVIAGSITISENTECPYLRWLGTLFDKKLTFKWHVGETASKALTETLFEELNPIYYSRLHRAVSSIKHTTVPKPSGQAVSAPGLPRLLAGARAVPPTFRTTPVSVLHRESGFFTPEIELDQIALLAAVRLRRLDPYHPLRKRAEQVSRNGRPISRFARRVLALPNSEQVNPLQYAPWYPWAPMGRTKEKAAADFLDFRHIIPGSDIIFLCSSLSFGPGKEVFDAEAEAALAGAQAAIALSTARFATNLWICLDNLEVATRLLSPSTGSSQGVFESFCTLAAAWPLRERLPHTKSGSIRIRWVPGHAKIPENGAADLAAKEGAASIPPSPHRSSYASLNRYAKAGALSTAQNIMAERSTTDVPRSWNLYISKAPR
ncbi:hypothetical protein TSTA_008970 [Talaromyces stipitatus ATCC 10500]|uniref:Uncharacterized protein n=1 Tax=Talaromyces stipitatus (strain ATCC 10500 / CBS 375.48 / QM 6759 / NRRL 1006) TaxID=441959 RepID=B8MF03_TALSN|nr:uncharacterized protein TSTA_008970 [Talaromyces stipitatus ATCC 10500]EED15772.1 hypothetical protein TSTA_008970 [Talaromyces stipitatus ATCC 10500]